MSVKKHQEIKKKEYRVTTVIVVVFLAIVLISAGSTLAIFTISSKALKNEIIANSFNTLQILDKESTQFYESAQMQLQQLLSNEDILRFTYDPAVDPPSDRYWWIPLWTNLKVLHVYHPELTNVLIYYPLSDVVISTRSSVLNDSLYLYSTLFPGKTPNCDSWLPDLNRLAGASSFSLSYNAALLPSEDGTASLVLYGKNLGASYFGNNPLPEVYVFLMFNPNYLLEKYARESSDEVQRLGLYFLNKENEIISYVGEAMPKILNGLSFNDKHGMIETENDTLIYSDPIWMNTRYATAYSKDSFWEKLQSVRLYMALLLLVFLSSSVLVISLYIHWNHSQYQKILNVAKKHGIDYGTPSNEYSNIMKIIDTTAASRKKLLEQLRRQNALVRSQFLQNLLFGKLSIQSLKLEEINSEYGLKLMDGRCAVLVYHTEDYHTRFYSEEQSVTENIQIFHFSMLNIAEELLNQKNYACSTDSGALAVTLVCLAEDSADTYNQLVQTVQLITEKIMEIIGASPVIAVSSIYSGLALVPSAYQEARQALEYRAFISESVLSAPRLAGISADAFQTQYSLMTEQQLFNFIKAGEADKAHALITKIFEENVQVCTNRSSENLKCLSYDIYSTLLKAAGELQVLYREDPDIVLLKRILCCTEYTRLFEEIDAAAGRLCRFSSEHTQSADTIYKEVARYIDQNFTNPNLNIGMLSETFRLSASYLSRLFKEGTGMGPLDYISIRRIEKAKMLLHDETLSAQAISGLSGFNEYHTFSRVFKKMEGISPQKYRELHHT